MCQLPPDSQLARRSQVLLVAASALLSDEETGAATAAAAVTATATLRALRGLGARWRGAVAINQPLGRLRSELSGSGGKFIRPAAGSQTVGELHPKATWTCAVVLGVPGGTVLDAELHGSPAPTPGVVWPIAAGRTRRTAHGVPRSGGTPRHATRGLDNDQVTTPRVARSAFGPICVGTSPCTGHLPTGG